MSDSTAQREAGVAVFDLGGCILTEVCKHFRDWGSDLCCHQTWPVFIPTWLCGQWSMYYGWKEAGGQIKLLLFHQCSLTWRSDLFSGHKTLCVSQIPFFCFFVVFKPSSNFFKKRALVKICQGLLWCLNILSGLGWLYFRFCPVPTVNESINNCTVFTSRRLYHNYFSLLRGCNLSHFLKVSWTMWGPELQPVKIWFNIKSW